MCGNGARCAARFAYMHGIAPASLRFDTIAGIIEAKVQDIDVSVRMTTPQDFAMNLQLEVDGEKKELHFVDTGVPHTVQFVDDIAGIDVKEQGSLIRHHSHFMPAGTNANFCGQLDDGSWKVRTYERGVEGETLACGTGAVACALISTVLGHTTSPVEMVTSGGDRLFISFDLKEGPAADNVFMKGPAHVIYHGELTSEALLEA
jgi:diaminopimelate epimerase